MSSVIHLTTETPSPRISKTNRFKNLVQFWVFCFAFYSSITQIFDTFEHLGNNLAIFRQVKQYKALRVILVDPGNIPLFQAIFSCVMFMDAIARTIFANRWVREFLQKPSDFSYFSTFWSRLIQATIGAMVGQFYFGGFTLGEPGYSTMDMQRGAIVMDEGKRRMDLVRHGWFGLVSMIVCWVSVKVLKYRCESPLMEAQIRKDEKSEDLKTDNGDASTIIFVAPDHDLEKGRAENTSSGEFV